MNKKIRYQVLDTRKRGNGNYPEKAYWNILRREPITNSAQVILSLEIAFTPLRGKNNLLSSPHHPCYKPQTISIQTQTTVHNKIKFHVKLVLANFVLQAL